MKCGEEVLKFLTTTLRTTLGSESFTDAHALQVELQLRRQFGGAEIYIPKLDRDARREAVLREFNGRNRVELCAKHKLSKSQFYRMLKGG